MTALDDGTYSVVAEGSQPIAVSESSYYTSASDTTTAAYPSMPMDVLNTQAEIANYLYLPRAAAAYSSYTPFNVMNLGTDNATVQVTYYDAQGQIEHQATLGPLPPAAATRQTPRTLGLTDGYEGSVVLSSDQPIAAWVDEYQKPPCNPPQNLQIQRTPVGTIEIGVMAHFTGTVQGTEPLTYTWDLGDGATAHGQTVAHSFSMPGTYTTTVNTVNACGSMTATHTVDVVVPTPDLSTSQKTATTKYVGPGDVLTYTLILRNEEAAIAQATLTDSVPTHTTYVSHSLFADQGTISFADNTVHWSGAVVKGSPVRLGFAVRIADSGLAPGDVLTNTAWLSDGIDSTHTLQVPVTYNPGYRVSIENGALYTNDVEVDLDIAWNANHDVNQMTISNDGGFGSGTGWIAPTTTYAGWTLTTFGDYTLPRTVYVQFRDSEGSPLATVQDDILYDPIKPEIVSVEVLPSVQFGTALQASTPVTVRVNVSDTLSGPASVMLSNDPSFESSAEHRVTGRVTDIPWELQASGKVFVRAKDEAGNLSEVVDENNDPLPHIYLPLVIR
jgi:uncharacterized repeat protein (TIGR01451 family)